MALSSVRESSFGDHYFYHGNTVSGNGQMIARAVAPDLPPHGEQREADAFALQEVKTAYMTKCENEGVPLPPPWGDAAWKLAGDLDQRLLFAGTGKTQLWTFSTEAGTCAALPRYKEDDTTVNLFGVICASKTGKTCFVDNASAKDGLTRVAVPKGYRVSDGAGADVLQENCTSCHRGDNPWVATPGEPTAKLLKTDLIPIGPAAWTNPKGDGAMAACEGCHSIPKLSLEYCRIGLSMFGRGVMPPRGKIDGQAAFADACNKL